LAGTVVVALRKRHRTLPFGPWLALGIVLAALVRDPLVDHLRPGLEGLRIAIAGS